MQKLKGTYFRYLLIGCEAFLCSFFLGACKDEQDISIEPYFQNHPLPEGQGRLRVLAIGNSFAEDAMYYVGNIVENLGVAPATCSVYCASHSSASLQHWYEVAGSNETVRLTFYGGTRMAVEQGTLPEILAQEWDVIILMQYSGLSVDYYTFNPWLHQIIDLIQQYCTNPNVTLAWQMAWSYNDTQITDYSNYERWALIALATQKMEKYDGINVIIPIGTAIQNARNTSLNSVSQLTRDGWHLNAGVGRYLAACTVVQSLFAPVYGITVQNDLFLSDIPPEHSYPLEPVTEKNRSLCHQCVINAVAQPFQVTR